jgi:hypothetical protein
MDSIKGFIDEYSDEKVPLQNSAQLKIYAKNVKDEQCVQHSMTCAYELHVISL